MKQSKTSKQIVLYLIVLLCSLSPSALANKARISGTNVGDYNIDISNRTNNTAQIRFNASWENSWRLSSGASNWDALWLFAKYSTDGGVTWRHAHLSDSGHIAPSGMTISTGLVDANSAYDVTSNPVVGVFLYRSSAGSGTVTANGVSLRWLIGRDTSANERVRVRMFATEMVYVPEGGFYAGDNATSDGAFRQGSSDNDPWYIGSEAAMSVTNSAGNTTGQGQQDSVYYYVAGTAGGGDATGTAFTIPAAFPKGYRAFYIMKYELSQRGWVEFFNMLTDTQKVTRDVTGGTLNVTGKASDGLVNRNNVSWSGTGGASLPNQGGGADYSNVAMNWVSWADITAYLDWTGLRPMTELEYEKASRGAGQAAVSGEYAWGTTSIVQATGIQNVGLGTEVATPSSANCAYGNVGGVQGPLRCGAFASTSMTLAGASYYGVLELSGNLWERVVTLGSNFGRLFTGLHGNGTLDNNGDSNVSNWPATNAQGAGFRGGGWDFIASSARLSDRYGAADVYSNRDRDIGVRGARLAP